MDMSILCTCILKFDRTACVSDESILRQCLRRWRYIRTEAPSYIPPCKTAVNPHFSSKQLPLFPSRNQFCLSWMPEPPTYCHSVTIHKRRIVTPLHLIVGPHQLWSRSLHLRRVGLMLAHRRRRWANIKPTRRQRHPFPVHPHLYLSPAWWQVPRLFIWPTWSETCQ